VEISCCGCFIECACGLCDLGRPVQPLCPYLRGASAPRTSGDKPAGQGNTDGPGAASAKNTGFAATKSTWSPGPQSRIPDYLGHRLLAQALPTTQAVSPRRRDLRPEQPSLHSMLTRRGSHLATMSSLAPLNFELSPDPGEEPQASSDVAGDGSSRSANSRRLLAAAPWPRLRGRPKLPCDRVYR
jgi:hypothetical protein